MHNSKCIVLNCSFDIAYKHENFYIKYLCRSNHIPHCNKYLNTKNNQCQTNRSSVSNDQKVEAQAESTSPSPRHSCLSVVVRVWGKIMI